MRGTVKQDAIDAISRLPDDASMDDIMYQLYVLKNIRCGPDDIASGKCHDMDQVRAKLNSW